MSQLVLAIEPDLRQAAIVKRIVRENALADVVVVDSRDAAIEAMRTSMPDVLLLSMLLSPRDEDELMAHLRTLDNAGHLQTHTIPQLASTLGPGEERGSRGLLSAFRRKKDTAPVPGCDPEMFADEIRTYLQRAADKKRLQQTENFVAHDMRRSAAAATAPSSPASDDDAAPAADSSSWSSPFEWKPSAPSRKKGTKTEAPAARAVAPTVVPVTEPTPAAEPLVTAPFAADAIAAAPVVSAEPTVATKAVAVEPVLAGPVAAADNVAIEPIVAPVAAAPEPIALVDTPIVAMPEVPAAPPVAEKPRIPEPPAVPVLHVAAHSDAAARPEAPVVTAKTKPVDPPRPKPVADRGPKLTGRIQIQDLLKTYLVKDGTGGDGLGPLARWARADAPRAAKSAAVTSDDVRALISSLAVPSAVASVTYPRGCHIRRVRVPASPEQPAA